MLKKICAILFFTAFSAQTFAAQQKEEIQPSQVEEKEKIEKETARLFYVENIINNKLTIEDEAQLLQFIYYFLKMKNAIRLSSQIKELDDKKLENLAELWESIARKNLSYAQDAYESFKGKYSGIGIWGVRKLYNFLDQFHSFLEGPDSQKNKALYTLLYRDIKAENPELLIIKAGDDYDKELPKPEDLKLPLFYWKKHGFENYKPADG